MCVCVYVYVKIYYVERYCQTLKKHTGKIES